MKFLVTWQVHPDQRHETFGMFSQMEEGDEDFAGVRLIGRWHDLVGFTGAAVCETDDPAALMNWLLSWNNVIDVDAVPVLDDDEAKAVGRAKLG